MQHGGIPLWAKILIGLFVPLFVFGIIGLILLCCWRRRLRRRRAARAQSSTPTPAFISNNRQPGKISDKDFPLASDDLFHLDSTRSKPHVSSNSDEFRTPIRGPSYEGIPPQPVAGNQIRRSSRHNSGNLYSLRELPVPMPFRHSNAAPIPLPPRLPQHSRGSNPDPSNTRNSSILNEPKRPSPYYSQAHYVGSFNQYSNPLRMDIDESPFLDPLSPYEAGHAAISEHDRSVDHDHKIAHDQGDNWPLQADSSSSNWRHSIPRKPLPHGVYGRVYEQ